MRLLFVDFSLTKRVGYPNIVLIQSLFLTFEKCTYFDMRSMLLKVIREAYIKASREDRKVLIYEYHLFSSLLGSIQRLSVADREVLSKIVDVAVTDGMFAHVLTQYVHLLKDPSPSLVITIARHINELLSNEKLNRSGLKEVGLSSILFEYLKNPIRPDAPLDKAELASSLLILNEGAMPILNLATCA